MRTLPQTSSFKTSPRYHRCRSSRLKRLKLTRKAALRKSPFCYVPARCPKAQNEALLELESFASREVNRFASSAERDVCSVRTFLEALLFELPSFATYNTLFSLLKVTVPETVDDLPLDDVVKALQRPVAAFENEESCLFVSLSNQTLPQFLEIVKLLKGGTLHPVSPFHTLLLIIFILRAVETLTATITAFLHTVLAPSGFMVKNGPPPVLAAEEFLLLRSVLRAPVTASNNELHRRIVRLQEALDAHKAEITAAWETSSTATRSSSGVEGTNDVFADVAEFASYDQTNIPEASYGTPCTHQETVHITSPQCKEKRDLLEGSSCELPKMIVTLPPYPPKRKLRGASLPDVVRSFEALQGSKGSACTPVASCLNALDHSVKAQVIMPCSSRYSSRATPLEYLTKSNNTRLSLKNPVANATASMSVRKRLLMRITKFNNEEKTRLRGAVSSVAGDRNVPSLKKASKPERSWFSPLQKRFVNALHLSRVLCAASDHLIQLSEPQLEGAPFGTLHSRKRTNVNQHTREGLVGCWGYSSVPFFRGKPQQFHVLKHTNPVRRMPTPVQEHTRSSIRFLAEEDALQSNNGRRIGLACLNREATMQKLIPVDYDVFN